MGRSSYWNFYPIIGILFQTLSLSDCEMYVVWMLGQVGPRSIVEIAKFPRYFPKPNLSRMNLPDDNMKLRLKDIPPTYLNSTRRPGFNKKRPPNYSKSAIYSAVDRLEKKSLVETISREPLRNVNLTFIGLMLYLQNSTEKGRFKNLFTKHTRLFPFSHLWTKLTQKFGLDECLLTLEKTIENFHGLEKIDYVTQLEKARLEAFYHPYSGSDLQILSNSELFGLMFGIYENNTKIIPTKNSKVWDFLQSEEALLLRETYIAYLAAQDMKKLVGLENESYDKIIVTLKSEKELAELEKREVMSNPLFKGGRLMKLFQNYSGIECYFTGMFVNNLLWNEKQTIKEG